MAFFGLTNLGPQNSFLLASKDATFFHIFNEEDYLKSWKAIVIDATTVKDKAVTYKTLQDVFKELYKGPIPANDNSILQSVFNEYNDSITYTIYSAVMTSLREKNEKEIADKIISPPPTELNSNYQYQTNMRKHIRPTEFKNVQKQPLLASQEVGWENYEYKRPEAGKPGSDITKFAAELVKNGIYY